MNIANGNLLSPGIISNNNFILVSNSTDAYEDSSNRQNQALLKQMQKKYSKSVDCYHYTDCNNHGHVPLSPNNANDARLTNNSTITNNNSNGKRIDDSSNQVKNNVETNSNNINSHNNIQLQRQYSQTSSPLIPRRNDYEPMTRVTIQRQQRVCDLSPTKSPNTPLTNSRQNVCSDDFDESNSYTNPLTQSNYSLIIYYLFIQR